MRPRSRTSLLLVLAALGAASAIVLGVASGAESGAARTAANPHLLLGVTNNAERFLSQTGQESSWGKRGSVEMPTGAEFL